MSKNLFDFTNEDVSFVEEEKKQIYKEKQYESIEQQINKYKNKSQSELLEELFSTVQKQKENGTFDGDKLNNMLNTVSPYLSSEQMQNIKGLLNKINDLQ